MRWVSTRVLPLPAPAKIRRGPSGAATASRWAGVRAARRASVPADPALTSWPGAGGGGGRRRHLMGSIGRAASAGTDEGGAAPLRGFYGRGLPVPYRVPRAPEVPTLRPAGVRSGGGQERGPA